MRARCRRVLTVTLLVMSVLAATPVASAHAGGAPADALSGTIHLEHDLRVAAGEPLHVGPGASFTGPGRILVHGTLTVHGNASAPVRFETPVWTFPGAVVTVHDAVFATRGVTAVDVRGGNVTLERARFEGALTGVRVESSPARAATLVAADATFRNVTTGVAVTGPGSARLANATFDGPFVGVDVTAGPAGPVDVRVEEAWFRESVARVRLVDGLTGNGRVTITGSTFEGTSLHAPPHAVHGRPALGVDVMGANVSGSVLVVASEGNAFLAHEAALAVHAPVQAADASGVLVISEGDTFEGNAVGVRVANARVSVRNATFHENTLWDVHAPAPLDRGLTLTNAPPAARVLAGPPATPAPAWPVPGAAFAVGVLVLAGVLAGVGARPASARVLPLAARALLPADALAAAARARVREYVTANPGVTLARVAEATGLPRLAVLVHACALERDGVLVRQRARDGRELHFVRHEDARRAPAAAPEEPAAESGPATTPALTRAERDVLAAIVAQEGSTQSALADTLGTTRQAVHYQVKKLVAAGLVTKVPHGRETRLYARDEAKTTLEAAE